MNAPIITAQRAPTLIAEISNDKTLEANKTPADKTARKDLFDTPVETVDATLSKAPALTPMMPTLSKLDSETRTHVKTTDAAFYLNRQGQTLRRWASTESGPIRPVHVYGRLLWPVAEIRRVLAQGG